MLAESKAAHKPPNPVSVASAGKPSAGAKAILSWLLMFRHHVRIRPEETLPVEVDHVVGVFGDPDFGFPGDVWDEGLHGAAAFEGGDKH